jgi:hypothetical protein
MWWVDRLWKRWRVKVSLNFRCVMEPKPDESQSGTLLLGRRGTDTKVVLSS